jgi:hypothetical protein
VLLVPEKASQRTAGCPYLGEADPGGLGACPQETEQLVALNGTIILVCSGILFPEEIVKRVAQKTMPNISEKPIQEVGSFDTINYYRGIESGDKMLLY